MILTLPDMPATTSLTADELKLELACALYARGKIGKIAGAELAGIDFFTFQKALGERQVSTYRLEDLEREIATLNQLFPDHPIPKPSR